MREEQDRTHQAIKSIVSIQGEEIDGAGGPPLGNQNINNGGGLP